MGIKVLVITPIFFGNGSGASTYYQALTNDLSEEGVDVSVISDKEKPTNNLQLELESKIKYYPLFPVRSLRHKRKYFDYILYSLQNLQYLKILYVCRKIKPDFILLHSSFFNHFSIFNYILKLLRIFNKNTKIILDVRDRGFNKKYLSSIKLVDKVIACSKNVENFMQDIGVESSKIIHIPVIQESINLDKSVCREIMAAHGLVGCNYIFYAGLIKETKRFHEIIDAFKLFSKTKKGYKLVLAGLIKESEKHMRKYRDVPDVYFIGNLDKKNLHCLMKNSRLCVNISKIEGMPRTSLEAIASGANVILPPNIPEFLEFSPECVYSGTNAGELADLMCRIIDNNQKAVYPLTMHASTNVLEQYRALFRV